MASDGTLKFDTSIDASGFNSGLSKLGSIASTGLKATTAVLTAAATAVVGLGTAAVKVGSEFETSMSQVAATMGVTADTIYEDGTKPFEVLSDAAKEAGETTQYSASEAAEALNYLALAGYDASTAAEVLPSVLNLAAAGGMDLAYASDLATDAMSALGIEASNENLTNFGDKMAVTAQKSNTSVSQLGEAILTVGATAQNLAGGTTELNTALGILADSGIKGSEGGTHLRNVLLSLQTASGDAADAIAEYTNGIYDAEGNMRPLNEIMGELNDSMSKMNDQQKADVLNKIFNKTDLAAAQTLIAGCASSVQDLSTVFAAAEIDTSSFGASIEEMAAAFDTSMTQEEYAAKAMEEYGVTADQAGVMYSGFMSVLSDSGSRFDELSGYIDDSTGAMADMADTMNDNLSGDIKILQSALQGLGISVYEELDSPLRDVVQTATDMVGQLSDAFKEGGFEGLVSEAGNVLAEIVGMIADAAPTLIQAAESVVSSFCGSLGITLADSGAELITTLATALFESSDMIWSTAIDLVGLIVDGIAEGTPQIVQAMFTCITDLLYKFNEWAPDFMAQGVAIISAIVQGISDNIGEIALVAVDIVMNLVNGLIEGLPDLLQAAITLLLAIVDAIPDIIVALIEALPELITTIVNFLIESIPELIQGAIQLLMGIIEAIPEIITAIAENLPLIIDALVQGITEGFPLILDGAIQLLMALIEAIPEIIVAIGENLPQIITAIATGLADAIPEILGCAHDLFFQIIEAIPDIVVSIGEAMPDIIQGIVNGLLDGVGAIGEAIVSLGGSLVDGFKSFFGIHSPSTVMEEQGDYLTAGLVNGLTELPDKMGEILSSALDSLTEWGANMLTTATEKITEVVSSIATTFSEMPGKIWEFLTTAVTNLIQWGVDMQSQASTAASNMINSIITWVQQLPGQIWQWLVNVCTKVTQWGVDLRSKAVSAVTTMINGILDTVKSLPDKFVSIGKNLVEGIWSGISNSTQWIKDKISGWVGSVTDFLKGLFGINSPSKLWKKEIGAWLLPGIETGVEESEPEVEAGLVETAGNLTSAMKEAVNGEKISTTLGTREAATYNSVTNDNRGDTYIDEHVEQHNEYNVPVATPSEVNKAQREAARNLAQKR